MGRKVRSASGKAKIVGVLFGLLATLFGAAVPLSWLHFYLPGYRQGDLLGRFVFVVMLILGCLLFSILSWYWIKVVSHQEELEEYMWDRGLRPHYPAERSASDESQPE